MFISDVDGTLVNGDKQLTAATIAAVERLKAAGIAMSLISARPPSGIGWIGDKLGLDGPFGAFNGGTIFCADGKPVEAHHLSQDAAVDTIDLFEGRIEYWIFANGCWYAHEGDNDHAKRERVSANQEPVVRDDFSGLTHKVDKIVGVSDDYALLDKIEERVRNRLGDRANVVRSQDYYCDITAPAANKGNGVAAIAEAIGIPLDATLVIGDMPNDLPMFARARWKGAMGQAPARVRDAADFVTASNDEDGVAKAIDALLEARACPAG
ncbi:Cof-type HAD-IIB family hydrolase [Stakelama sediminis]